MLRTLRSILALMPIALVAGCTTGNSPGPSTVGTGSLPFSMPGTWTGSETDAGLNQTGTLTLGIAVDGRTAGSLQNSTTQQTGAVTGSITTAGTAMLLVAYPNVSYSLTGPVSIAGTQHLTGALTERLNGTVVGSVSIDLTRKG